jgi:hypothetical protein
MHCNHETPLFSQTAVSSQEDHSALHGCGPTPDDVFLSDWSTHSTHLHSAADPRSNSMFNARPPGVQ